MGVLIDPSRNRASEARRRGFSKLSTLLDLFELWSVSESKSDDGADSTAPWRTVDAVDWGTKGR